MIAVILAGGKGTRLRPYTVSLPKPLMPVGDRPILEIIINQLKQAGVKKIILAVGYLESLIRAYFGDGSRFGVEIVYSIEDEPLGTAGPLRLLKGTIQEPFIFMNGDILTDMDFKRILAQHTSSGSVATIGVSTRKVDIDFGVIELDESGGFSKWNEKPTIKYYVSMGIYVLSPSAIDSIPDGFFNMPDLIVKMKGAGERVGVFNYEGYWLDIGRVDDYHEACAMVKDGKEF